MAQIAYKLKIKRGLEVMNYMYFHRFFFWGGGVHLGTEAVLKLFLIFRDFEARGSYKIVLIKQGVGIS